MIAFLIDRKGFTKMIQIDSPKDVIEIPVPPKLQTMEKALTAEYRDVVIVASKIIFRRYRMVNGCWEYREV